jgi:adenylate cyclase
MTPTLHTIRDCLEGAVPAVIATCDPQGVPNVSYVSEVHYVDASHVALSYQFFSKTRQNVLCNPQATVLVIHPHSGGQYRLVLRYLRTEQSGPLFESMKAKLAGIASHTGMSGVFALRGSDVYHVERIEEACGPTLPVPARETNLLAQLRLGATRLAAAGDLNALVDELLATLREKLAITHGMVLLRDAATGKLFTVASFGYRQSGVGAEIAPGQGVIGVAAQEGTPIRLSHATSEFGYGRAVRRSATGQGLALGSEQEIPFPGLPESRSQLAVPVKGIAGLIGVLFVESTEDGRFGYDDEDALIAGARDTGLIRPAAANTPLLRERQHLLRGRIPDQGRGGRHTLEARPCLRRRRPQRTHEPRVAAGFLVAAPGAEREPRGPADTAAAAPAGALSGAADREDGSWPVQARRRTTTVAGRSRRRRPGECRAGPGRTTEPELSTNQGPACADLCSTCGTKSKKGVSTFPPGAT